VSLALALATALLGTAASAEGRGGASGPAAYTASRTVPVPRLTRPPAGIHGHPLWDSWHKLGSFGYLQREYFVSGTARASDASAAPYTTRIIVFRPREPKRFNGTVLLDWVNVSGQFENAVDILEAREYLLRQGYAFVHVSAQRAGLCCTPLTPKVWDPERYASISHPGDDYAPDMFSQIAKAMRATRPGDPDPMRGLRVRRVLAAGQSQSAGRLYEYVDTRQAADRVVDGFLIHGYPVPPIHPGSKDFDKPLTAPVVHLLSDAEAHPSPPPRDPRYRLWEVAGTAHSDHWIGYQSVYGNGRRLRDEPALNRRSYRRLIHAAGNYGQDPTPLYSACTVAGATMPMHYTTSTALHLLDRWVRTGRSPRRTPRFVFDGQQLARDEHGNARGGVRLPPVEVPVATYRSTDCGLGGVTDAFPDQRIHSLYPTFEHYQRRMRRTADVAVREGWLLPRDAADQMRRACSVRTRYPVGDRGTCRTYRPPAFDSAPR
jgi:hypothetical protein